MTNISLKPPRRRTAIVLGVTLLAAAAATVSALPAGAASPTGKDAGIGEITQTGPVPGGFSSWEELLQVQERMDSAADRIVAAAHIGDTGYAGIVAAPENRELRVYWKGTPPGAVNNLLAELRHDVNIKVLPARHSERELTREAERITKKAAKGGLSSVGPKVDGSGLTVSVPGGNPDTARPTISDVTVPVDIQANVRPAPFSRFNDSPPWWGGAVWQRNFNLVSGCSTGFAVWHEGRSKMLSAGHCGDVGDSASDPTGEFMGYVTQDNNTRDILLIDAPSGGYAYNNNATQEYANPVYGAHGNYVGNWVCTSGAFSGSRCGIQVTQTGFYTFFSDGGNPVEHLYWVGPLVVAEKTDHTMASGNGDSGGPVYEGAWDRYGEFARGTISGGDTSTAVPCTSHPAGRTCSWRIYYADIITALNTFGASIVTGPGL